MLTQEENGFQEMRKPPLPPNPHLPTVGLTLQTGLLLPEAGVVLVHLLELIPVPLLA